MSTTEVTITVTINGTTKTFTATARTGTAGNEVARGLVDALSIEANRWIGGVHTEAPQPRITWPEHVRRHAATLRAAYPKGLPRHPKTGEVIVRRIRTRMEWSADKAVPAVRAYLAGADLADDDQELDRVEAIA